MSFHSLLSRLCGHRNILRLGFLALKTCIFLPLPLLSQDRAVLSVSIPFTFSTGRHVMPGGDYLVYRISDHIYSLRATKGSDIQYVTVTNEFTATAPVGSKLIFRNYNGQYFLANLWFSGSRDGFKLPASKAEKELIAAAHGSTPPGVLVAVRAPREPQQ